MHKYINPPAFLTHRKEALPDKKILKCLCYVSVVLSQERKEPIANPVIQTQQVFRLELDLFLTAFSSNICLLSMEIKDLKVLTALSKKCISPPREMSLKCNIEYSRLLNSNLKHESFNTSTETVIGKFFGEEISSWFNVYITFNTLNFWSIAL